MYLDTSYNIKQKCRTAPASTLFKWCKNQRGLPQNLYCDACKTEGFNTSPRFTQKRFLCCFGFRCEQVRTINITVECIIFRTKCCFLFLLFYAINYTNRKNRNFCFLLFSPRFLVLRYVFFFVVVALVWQQNKILFFIAFSSKKKRQRYLLPKTMLPRIIITIHMSNCFPKRSPLVEETARKVRELLLSVQYHREMTPLVYCTLFDSI